MARRVSTSKKAKDTGVLTKILSGPAALWRFMRKWIIRTFLFLCSLAVLATILMAFVNPLTNIYMLQESRRLGGVEQQWVTIENIAPVMGRSVVAAEDANFCLHWGLDSGAIRDAIIQGGSRGGSTISQQTVKNVFLWHGRSYVRKALEAIMTPMVEIVWSKQRILEVYLNVAEFDEGIFGVSAASWHYFGVPASHLSSKQAAQLAAVLPNPKKRSAVRPSSEIRRRANSIQDGAALIAKDGRADCFQ